MGRRAMTRRLAVIFNAIRLCLAVIPTAGIPATFSSEKNLVIPHCVLATLSILAKLLHNTTETDKQHDERAYDPW